MPGDAVRVDPGETHPLSDRWVTLSLTHPAKPPSAPARRPRNRTPRLPLPGPPMLCLAGVEPGQAFIGKDMSCRRELPGLIKRPDMKMGLGRQTRAFAGQCRSTPGAEPAPRSSRRRIELCDLTRCDRIGGALERDKNRSRRAAMFAATLTMTPIYSFWLTARNKTDRTAQAAAFELAGHDPLLPDWLIHPPPGGYPSIAPSSPSSTERIYNEAVRH
jgi:hypothetical protein